MVKHPEVEAAVFSACAHPSIGFLENSCVEVTRRIPWMRKNVACRDMDGIGSRLLRPLGHLNGLFKRISRWPPWAERACILNHTQLNDQRQMTGFRVVLDST